MKERKRVVALRNDIEKALEGTRAEVMPRDRVRAYPNQIIVRHGEREFAIAITENRISRLK